MYSDPIPFRTNRSWIMVIGVVLGTLALWGGWFGIRRYREETAVKAWEDFKTRAEASGESFAWSPVSNPVPVPDDQNFLGHPWIRTFIASHDNPPRSFIDALESSRDAGYVPVDSGKSWLKDHPAASASTLAIGKAHEADLAALREAAARPGISLVHFDSIEVERLGKISSPLALHAEAALATADTGTAVADLETLLQIGGHLHKIPSMMALVVAAGFEGRGTEVIQAGLKTGAFSTEQRHRLALACRSSPIEPDLAGAMRSERAFYLLTLDRASLPVGISIRPEPLFDTWGRFSPKASLAFCELLQPGLDLKADAKTWNGLAAESARLSGDKHVDHAIGFAAACLDALLSAAPQILLYDKDLQDIRGQLAK